MLSFLPKKLPLNLKNLIDFRFMIYDLGLKISDFNHKSKI